MITKLSDGEKIIATQWARVYPSGGFRVEARVPGWGKLIVWPFAEIESLQKKSTLGLMPNAILVTMKSGGQDTIIVWPRDSAINAFNQSKNS
jgi:hypothetical protein